MEEQAFPVPGAQVAPVSLTREAPCTVGEGRGTQRCSDPIQQAPPRRPMCASSGRALGRGVSADEPERGRRPARRSSGRSSDPPRRPPCAQALRHPAWPAGGRCGPAGE